MINPKGGWGGTNSGYVFDAGKAKTVDEIITADSLTIGDKEIPAGTAAELAGLMEQRGIVVTPESLMQQLALFAESKL